MSTDTRQQQQRTPNEYDREKEVKKFDESKLGVKGLLDSDVSHIPPFFYFPPQSLLDLSFSRSNQNDIIPLIDLSAPHPHVVDRVRAAAASSGFFQVVNHSVPVTLLDELIEGVKAFHELPSEEKADHYTRDMQNDVAFFSNIDLLASKAASWRDTLMIRLGPIVAQSNSIPHVCREAVIEWEKEVTKAGEQVMGLLSEGLGLKANKLKEMDCLANRVMVGHYYPYCPEPDKTIGITAHTDPGVVTVLVQDRVGGLQVKVGEEWVNVSRVRGALVVNVGDLLQIVNHTIPVTFLERLIDGVKAFHELPGEEKVGYYTRNTQNGVGFFSNVDLFLSKAASWRDTLQIRLGPTMARPDAIPPVCREEVIEWEREVTKVGEEVMGLLSEGLGVKPDKLKEMTCLANRVMVGHYYPYCPEPDKTVGIAGHSDPGVLTVLVQDQVGGLQVKVGEDWVDVRPVHGALVINVGDLLQMISNDQYKSVEHRVLANNSKEPRVSVGVFFNPSARENSYGPLPELVTPEKAAVYRQFTYSDFISRFFTKGLDGKSLIDYFKLSNE